MRGASTPRVEPSRRQALIGLALGVLVLLGLLSAIQAPTSSAETPRTDAAKPTIVLVHGAWASTASWSGVISRLQSDGYVVYAPPNPLRGLRSDAASIADFLQTIPGPIVLVGHSYGGTVITNAARGNPKVKALVYVDAFIPAKGESTIQLASARPGSCLGGGGDPTKVFNLVPYPGNHPGDFELYAKTEADAPYPGFTACFANDLTPAQAAVMAATQSPVTLSALNTPSGRPAWATIPSWALVGTVDNVLPPAEQLSMARRAHAHIKKVAAGHLSMVSHPRAATNLIVSAATATS